MPSESIINEDGEVAVGADGCELVSDGDDACAECCGEGGCTPYPACVAYEHGTLITGATTTPWPCGLKMPSTGNERVTAAAHVRGRRTDWNAGGPADDIVGYSIGGAELPAEGEEGPGWLCATWVASENDGCLTLKEFVGDAELGIQYRGQTPGSVLVVVHVTTDGKRWKVRATPKTDGAIVRNPGGGPVTDPRAFVGLEFGGGVDAGQCDGTIGVRDHASKLIVEGVDSGAFTDDAKYWVQLLVPAEIEHPDNTVNQDLTCKLPTSTRCSERFASGFYNDQSIPTAYTWRLRTRTRMQNEVKTYSNASGTVRLTNEVREDFRFAADMVGQTCEQSCTGVIDPANPTRNGSIEAGSTWTVNVVEDYRAVYNDDGSLAEESNEAGTITTTWTARETMASSDWSMNVWCQAGGQLNGTANSPIAVRAGNATYATQVKTGFYATLGGWLPPFTQGPAVATAASQLVGTEIYAFPSSNGVFTWSVALGREFTSRTHYEYNTTGFFGTYSRMVYDSDMSVSLEALSVACTGERALPPMPPVATIDQAVDAVGRMLRGEMA